MFDIQEELKNLPEKPGVYIMKDDKGEVIYVGKAVVLKNRVRQYFHAVKHTPKVAAMVSYIKEFEYIVTDSEMEALILECNLIKKYKPRFNILLKDDKHYPYIKVTMNEEYPRILKTRRIDKNGAKYFGPYLNVGVINDTISLLRKLFPVKSCKKVLPRDIGKERPCLNFFIGQCIAPCQGNVNKEEYRNIMKDICLFLGGRHEEIMRKLEAQMQEYSENMEFEKAAVLRDKINSLKQVAEKQKVLSTNMEDQDIIAAVSDATDSCIQVFFVRGGKLLGREHFLFDQTEAQEGEFIISFLKQFYGAAQTLPREIIVQGKYLDEDALGELNIIGDWLSQMKGSKVAITVPKRGQKLEMVKMVEENARISLEQNKNELAKSEEGLETLARLAGLNKIPERIEAYDISNTGSSDIVASMVVFEKGKPSKRDYRRFKIKSTASQDDYKSMQEATARRFRHAIEEAMENAEENPGENKKENVKEDAMEIVGANARENVMRSAGKNAAENKNENIKENMEENTKENSKENAGKVRSGKAKINKEDLLRMVKEGEKPGKFSKMPDLILVDGGVGHVNSVQSVLKDFNLSIPVLGMVKDDKHKTRGLAVNGKEIDLYGHMPVLRLVTAIQDEAHRFALEYNKKLRSKRYSKSALDEIEGIGSKRKKLLLKHFGSVSAIKAAGIDDLTAVEGISEKVARKIYDYFH
ncbi:MAG TPA: excinuclease ABC subunit UvrC [Clostridiaceae bacterium]|jgi:excinuclease ABC subunit C|nr:excinuclease ABC subunit UvrC [Clostridiaceae bacterium]